MDTSLQRFWAKLPKPSPFNPLLHSFRFSCLTLYYNRSTQPLYVVWLFFYNHSSRLQHFLSATLGLATLLCNTLTHRFLQLQLLHKARISDNTITIRFSDLPFYNVTFLQVLLHENSKTTWIPRTSQGFFGNPPEAFRDEPLKPLVFESEGYHQNTRARKKAKRCRTCNILACYLDAFCRMQHSHTEKVTPPETALAAFSKVAS